MILIYSDTSTTRLQYICKFIFNEQLGVTHSITIDAEGFRNHDGPKINYSKQYFTNALNIETHGLLSENGIHEQQVNCFDENGYKAFFKSKEGADFPFDIFAASFYLISRYEEYLPHELDIYGRYAHENSLAFRQNFLQQPVVNTWIHDFADFLQKKHPQLILKKPSFKFIPTYDIDIAYSFKHKGFFRNLGGFVKSPSIQRLSVLSRLSKDPFDSYGFMDALHQQFKLDPVYFFLVATSASIYDKNISPYSSAMWRLVKEHGKKYRVGLHPSWRSNKTPTILTREKKVLETAADKTIIDSRQHYIKMSLPATYANLISTGIQNDFSMGYGSINGFRASVASSFHWYNLLTEKITNLVIYPFCFMDANSFYEQQLTAEEAYEELTGYLDICKKNNSTLVSIFHNNFLGTDKQFDGWKEMYTKFLGNL